jgi:hypothetical protein
MMQRPALVSRLVAFLLISSCICLAASAQKNGAASNGGSTTSNDSVKTAPPQAIAQIQMAVVAVEKIRQVSQAFHSKF